MLDLTALARAALARTGDVHDRPAALPSCPRAPASSRQVPSGAHGRLCIKHLDQVQVQVQVLAFLEPPRLAHRPSLRVRRKGGEVKGGFGGRFWAMARQGGSPTSPPFTPRHIPTPLPGLLPDPHLSQLHPRPAPPRHASGMGAATLLQLQVAYIFHLSAYLLRLQVPLRRPLRYREGGGGVVTVTSRILYTQGNPPDSKQKPASSSSSFSSSGSLFGKCCSLSQDTAPWH